MHEIQKNTYLINSYLFTNVSFDPVDDYEIIICYLKLTSSLVPKVMTHKKSRDHIITNKKNKNLTDVNNSKNFIGRCIVYLAVNFLQCLFK